jgi:hypothetical protein
LRRLVVLSALLILAGLLLLLPSSDLYSILTTGSTTSGLLNSLSSTDDTSTIESMLGFGLIGVGLVLELFSLFTDVGSPAPPVADVIPEMAAMGPGAPSTLRANAEEKKP